MAHYSIHSSLILPFHPDIHNVHSHSQPKAGAQPKGLPKGEAQVPAVAPRAAVLAAGLAQLALLGHQGLHLSAQCLSLAAQGFGSPYGTAPCVLAVLKEGSGLSTMDLPFLGRIQCKPHRLAA